MPRPNKSQQQPEVLVLRVDAPQPGFRWEVRMQYGGLPMIAGDEVYPSQTEARCAGQQALDRLRQEGQLQT